MPDGAFVAVRLCGGIALIAYAAFSFRQHGHGIMPLVPAVVGAFLLLRGLLGRL